MQNASNVELILLRLVIKLKITFNPDEKKMFKFVPHQLIDFPFSNLVGFSKSWDFYLLGVQWKTS